MDKKAFFEMVRDEANSALSKVFDKVEEVSKVSGFKYKNHNLNSQIKDLKIQIGEVIVNNPDDFEKYPEIKVFLDKIDEINDEIDSNNEKIKEFKEKEEKEEKEETD